MMLDYIRGRVASSCHEKVVIDVGGLGYGFFIPMSTYSRLPNLQEETTLYISSVIREDSHRFFGFLTYEERDLFEILGGITGFGPKTALALIGHLDTDTLRNAVVQGNVQMLTKVPGVGKKSAERLIIELRDKLYASDKHSKPLMAPSKTKEGGNLAYDATSALVNLGYAPAVAQLAVQAALKAEETPPTLPKLITAALQKV